MTKIWNGIDWGLCTRWVVVDTVGNYVSYYKCSSNRLNCGRFLAFHWSELLSWTYACLPTTSPYPGPFYFHTAQFENDSPRFIPNIQDRATETPTDLRSSANIIIPLLFKEKIVLYLRAHILQSADILNQRLLKPSVVFSRATKRERAVLTYSLSLHADSKQQVCYTSHPAGTLHFKDSSLKPLADCKLGMQLA